MRNKSFYIVPIMFMFMLTSLFGAEKIVTVKIQANSEAQGYEAWRAMDGNPQTLWHTEWQGTMPKHPHFIIVDLGNPYEISGFTYLPRPEASNGTIKDYELYVSNDQKNFGEPVSKGAFTAEYKETEIKFDKPVTGRYVRLTALSEAHSKEYGSIGEFRIISPGVVFKANENSVIDVTESFFTSTTDPEIKNQYLDLNQNIKSKATFDRFADQTFRQEALIHEIDRDPTDIILRRTSALLNDIKRMQGAPDLSEHEKQLSTLISSSSSTTEPRDREARFRIFEQAYDLRRKIAFSNPLLDFDQLLFIKRERSKFNHMCDQYYGANAVPGGGVFVLSNPFSEKQNLRNVLENSVVTKGRLKDQKLDTGGFLSPELSYDGKTIYFAYVEGTGPAGHIQHLDHENFGHWTTGRCYHIFSTAIDGSDLAQLTDGTWNDFDPCLLPNGRLAFISERRGGYLRCGRECPSYTVYDMKTDGSDIRMMSPHENNEWQPSVTHDGMIIYTRWDYVDRHGCTAHHPWIMTPDGRDSRAMHGNFSIKSERADMEMDLRSIPGSNKIAGTASPHHGQAYGSLIIYDPRIPDDDAMAPVKRLTPDVGFPESQGGRQVYGTPWPLSEDYYLCVYDAGMKAVSGSQGSEHRPGNYGIYLVDSFGNKILVYRDLETACLSPMPLRPRKMPPVIPEKSERLASNPSNEGTMALMNVYDSLKPWPEGTKIKALRIYQTFSMSVPSGNPPHETGRRINSAGDSVNLARRIIGTVPVEDDGSAHFKVPAVRELYFQALDENGLAIQSMRSATWVQPGETLVCQGCHEPKNKAIPQPKNVALALKRGPSIPQPDVDGTNPFSYPRLVQPVLDKKCVACHEKGVDGKKGPPLDSTIVQDNKLRNTRVFRSYQSLIHDYAFWNYGDTYRTTPGKFGALASKLYPMLKKGHHDVKLTDEEMHRITVWLDSVSNFYGVYEKEGGLAQLRGEIVMPTLQ